ncbi:MAG: cell division protein FtsA [Bdellovibrionales bacterium]|nr:cell division protein FtsA [Bdellovibrionales bacterium]
MSKIDAHQKHVIASLDIGTTKVACVIATASPDGVEIAGVGTAPNHGVRQGVVVNIEATAEAIIKAKEEAELMSGLTVTSVWLGIVGSHIQSFDSSGMVAIRNEEVAEDDIKRVIEAAKAVAIPADRQVLHVIPSDFKIDGQDGISDPIGMSGVRLESSVHIITGGHAAIQNAVKCTEKAGLRISGLVVQQLASAMAVLSEDEKSLGVAVVDMGGGTCDLMIYGQGSVVYTDVIPIGGNNFTHDVAMGLRTTQVDAESLKRKFGCALPDMVNEEETIEVEGVGGRQSRTLARRNLCHVLEARTEETLELIRERIRKSGFYGRLGSGIVLTGGASQLAGLVEMGDFIFDVPVRLGVPTKIKGLTDVVKSSAYATAVGLLLFGYKEEKNKIKVPVAEPNSGFSSRLNDFAQKVKGIFAKSL